MTGRSIRPIASLVFRNGGWVSTLPHHTWEIPQKTGKVYTDRPDQKPLDLGMRKYLLPEHILWYDPNVANLQEITIPPTPTLQPPPPLASKPETISSSKDDAVIIRNKSYHVPVKPPAPGPEECCQNGCVHCVYGIYVDELSEYKESMKELYNTLDALSPPLKQEEWPAQLARKKTASSSSKLSEKDEALKESLVGLDPSLMAFLAMERKLKAKKAAANAYKDP